MKHCRKCTMEFTEFEDGVGVATEVTGCGECGLPMTVGIRNKRNGGTCKVNAHYRQPERWDAAQWISEGPFVPLLKRTG